MVRPEDHLSGRLDDLLAELPEDAWTISHSHGYKVCTIVIDWRKVPEAEITDDPENVRRLPDRPVPGGLEDRGR